MKRLEKRYYSMKFVLPAMIIFMIFFIIPNLASFALGFTDWTIYNFDDMKFNGFDNFKRLFNEPNFWLCVKNTFFFAIVTVIGKNVVGFVMALIVNKTTKYNSLLRGMVFLPITISALVVAIIFQSIYNPTNGLLNSFLKCGSSIYLRCFIIVLRYCLQSCQKDTHTHSCLLPDFHRTDSFH